MVDSTSTAINTFNHMESNQSSKNTFYKVFQSNFYTILSYLNIQSLMRLLQSNKLLFELVNRYCNMYLTTNKIITTNDLIKDQIPMEDSYKLFRLYFSRDTLLANININNYPVQISQSSSGSSDQQSLNFIRYTKYSNCGIKYFSIGQKFTAWILYDDTMIYLKTEDYTNPLYNIKALGNKNQRRHVKKVFTSSKNLLYLTTTGQLYIIFYEEHLPLVEFIERAFEPSIYNPIKDCQVSYTYAIMTFNKYDENNGKDVEETSEIIKKIEGLNKQSNQAIASKSLGEENKEDIKKSKSSDVRILSFTNMTPQSIHIDTRFLPIYGLKSENIRDFCVGGQLAYFIDTNLLVWECDFNIPNENLAGFLMKVYEPLKKKKVRKIYCGLNYFFAVERDEIESIDKWNNDEVLKWAEAINYNDYLKIIKYENVLGKDLIHADKKYLINTLGIGREDLQTKIFYEISKVSKPTYGKQKLYGWGNNICGQLGINTGIINITHPISIPLPDLERDHDEILKIECGWKQSAIFTKNNKLYLTDPIIKINTKNQGSSEQNDKSNQAKGEDKQKKKGSTKTEEKDKKPKYSSQNEKEKGSDEPILRWFDVSDKAKYLKDSKIYKIINVSMNRDYLAILGGYLGNRTQQNKSFIQSMSFDFNGNIHHKSGQNISSTKLKDADQIINRIKWDKQQNKDDFTVGYEDRFLGMMEISFTDFENSEIPLHRIKYFKRKGDIVWDRANKIYNFS